MINLNLKVITGVYVGTKNVCLAQIKGTLFGPVLVKFGQAEITATTPEDESVRRQAIVKTLRDVAQRNGISAKRVIAAIPGKDVVIRYFQMPRIPRQELATAVKFESKKYMPFKLEELIWDFHVTFPKDKDAKLDVTFAAVKKDIAQNYLSLLEQAGLKPHALEPAPFSLVRLFAANNQLPKDKPTAVVEIDYGQADINIVKNKTCYLTRDISLPLEEEVIFDNLLNELRMSLDYYEKLFPADMLGKILLSGEVERQGWERRLSDELKVPVEKADLAKAAKIQRLLPPVNVAVAFGSALRGLTRPTPMVNLYRAPEVKPRPATKREVSRLALEIRLAVFRAVVLSCLGLLPLYYVMCYQVGQEQRSLEQVVALRPEIGLAIGDYSKESLSEQKSLMEKKLAGLDLLIDQRVFWTEKFNELPKVIPPGIWLTDLIVSEGLSKGNRVNRLLSIKGVAYHEDPVQEIGLVTKFVDQLKGNRTFARGFARIQLEAMSSGELKDFLVKNFTVSCFKK